MGMQCALTYLSIQNGVVIPPSSCNQFWPRLEWWVECDQYGAIDCFRDMLEIIHSICACHMSGIMSPTGAVDYIHVLNQDKQGEGGVNRTNVQRDCILVRLLTSL